MIEQLSLTHVFTRKDARPIVEATVRGLVDSIREVGIINPIRVRPARRFVAGVEANAWEVTAGAHRVTAARRLGLETVPAFVVSDDDLHAELAMIDENLMRAELKGIARDDAFRRRKEIYQELHPETAHGGDRKSDQVAFSATRFTKATANELGVSERSIQLAVEHSEKICEEAKELLRGTPVDSFTDREKLKKLEPEKQLFYVNRRLAEIARRDQADKEEREAQREKNREKSRTRRECDEANASRVVENMPHETLEAFVADLYGAGHKSLADEIKARLGASVMDENYSTAAE
jgi:ParB/RepB/Spo0J family partition protein